MLNQEQYGRLTDKLDGLNRRMSAIVSEVSTVQGEMAAVIVALHDIGMSQKAAPGSPMINPTLSLPAGSATLGSANKPLQPFIQQPVGVGAQPMPATNYAQAEPQAIFQQQVAAVPEPSFAAKLWFDVLRITSAGNQEHVKYLNNYPFDTRNLTVEHALSIMPFISNPVTVGQDVNHGLSWAILLIGGAAVVLTNMGEAVAKVLVYTSEKTWVELSIEHLKETDRTHILQWAAGL